MKLSSVLFSLLVAGCLSESGSPSTEVSGTGSDGKPIPGSIGMVKLREHESGPARDVTYVVSKAGHMIYEGDIDLGPAPDQRLRGEVIVGAYSRWPNGIVHAGFSSALSADTIHNIKTAMQDWSAHVPGITFALTADPDAPPYLLFVPSDDPGVSSSPVGPQWYFGPFPLETRVKIWNGNDDVGPSSVATIEHEIGHALGFFHEVDRPDRDTAVLYSPQCTLEDRQHNFEPTDDPQAGPFTYDIHSIMQYSSDEFCISEPSSELVGGCFCYPLVTTQAHGNNDNRPDAFISRSGHLSMLDTTIMQWAYEAGFGQHVAGHKFGAAVATGDFDGDGIEDVAVGSPSDGWAGQTQAGAVYIYRGVPGGGLVAWNKISETDLPGVVRAGDHFGAALAVADFDGDGADDLVVGAPDSAPANHASLRAGVTYVLFGGPSPSLASHAAGIGLNRANVKIVSQELTNVAIQDGAGFGSSLATGNFDGDGVPGLAVGAPSQNFNNAQAGYVNTFSFNRNTQAFKNRLGINEPNSVAPAKNDQFGFSLAVGDFNHDGQTDLAVGAPNHRSGAVFVSTAVGSTDWATSIAITEPAGGDANGDRFGAALIVGNFDGARYSGSNDLKKELVIGAPGAVSDAGRLHVEVPVVVSNLSFNHAQVMGAISPPGNKLGGVLLRVPNPTTGFDDVVAGLPNDGSRGQRAGTIWILHGATSGLQAPVNLGTWSAAGQQLGNALALMHDRSPSDPSPHVIAGAVGNDNSAGALASFKTATPNQVDVRDETTATPLL